MISPEIAPRMPGAGTSTEARLLALVRTLSVELHGGDTHYEQATLDSQFEQDLGFDSLARAELLARIEAASGVQLPVETFASAATPREVLLALMGQPSREAQVAAHPSAAVGAPAAGQAAAGELGVPRDASTLTQALHWHADRTPDRTHIVFIASDGVTESRMSYAELRDRASRMAGGLRTLGIDPGDRVALMLPTSLDYFAVFTAILLCGAIAVPIYPPARISQLAEHVERHVALLTNAQVKALVTFDEASTVGHLLSARVPTLRYVLTPERIARLPADSSVQAHADDIALLQYTSGSTGAPKGVMLTHANLLATIRAMGERIAVTPSDVLISWLPLYHDMGLIGAWMAPLYYGIPLILTSPLTFLARPEIWLRMITRYCGTITAAPNFAYDRCVRHLPDTALEGVDLSSLRLSFCGAEPVSAKTMRAFAERMRATHLDAHALAPVYGLAENTLALTFPSPGRGLRTDMVQRTPLADQGLALPARDVSDTIEVVCCGSVLSGSALRIADEHGRELPEREIGRIEFRGAAATTGYYRNPDKTAQLMDGDWLDTGDLGYLANGELYVTGRVKDVIIRGGRHFFPYELEDAIGRLPGAVLGGVAVCGGSDVARGTERVIVFAETPEADPGARTGLIGQINTATIACFGSPAERVVLVAPGSILKTPAGKIRHAAMLERFEQSEREGQSSRALSVQHAIWRQLSEVAIASVRPLLLRAGRRIGGIAYGVWFWGLGALIAPVLWAWVAWGSDEARNWQRTVRAVRLFLRLTGLHPEVAGHVRGIPVSASIMACNHMSYLDTLVLFACLPRPVHFVAKRELASAPMVGRFLKALGVRFVERADYRTSLEDEARLVSAAASETLLIFPEGTFRRAAGLGPFHLGAFRAACLAGRPVVPIALRGTRAVLRDGDWLPRCGPITVTVLAPIAPDGTDLRAMAKLRNAVRAAILAHCGEPELAGGGMGGAAPEAPALPSSASARRT